MAKRPRRGAAVRGKLSIDPKSYAAFERQMKRLMEAARKEIIQEALLAGAAVVHDEAEQHAPGPHIEVELMERGDLKKVSSLGKNIGKDSVLAAIGPDADHWHYRFSELGATPHDIAGSPFLAFEGRAGTVIVRGVKAAGGVAAKPFLRPAMESKRDEAIAAMEAVLKREIGKI